MAPLLLGIDVGTSAVKAVVIDSGGAVRAVHTEAHDLHTPKPLWAEQEPHDWERGAIAAIRAVLAIEGVSAEAIAAIGLTGQMHGLVMLDGDGAVIRPAILWNDQRTGRQCESIHDRLGRERVIAVTGKPVLTGFTAPKILWVAEHEPEQYARLRQVLLPKDFVRYRLSGTYAIDVADASGTSLLDLHSRQWSEEMIAGLGLERSWFPQVFESPQVCASVSRAAAEATGLVEGTPIVAGAGDQAAEAVGCGALSDDVFSVAVGTSGVVFATTREPRIDPQGRLHAYCHAGPGLWHVMGVMLSAGGSLQWHRDTLCADLKTRAASEGREVYDLMMVEAATVAPGCDGLVFLPYLTGERTPHADPYARGAFVGLTRRHSRAHLTRAVIEGVSFGLRDLLELSREIGMRPARVRLSGGGARSGLWRQMLADVLRTPAATVNVSQGAAYGAALLAGVGAGVYPDVEAAAAATVRETSVTEPGPEAERYEGPYAEYRALYPALRESFRRLGGAE